MVFIAGGFLEVAIAIRLFILISPGKKTITGKKGKKRAVTSDM